MKKSREMGEMEQSFNNKSTKKNPLPAIDYRLLFEALPIPYLVFLPDSPRFTAVAVNNSYLATTRARREDIVGVSLQEVFEFYPINPDDPSSANTSHLVAQSLNSVIQGKQADTMDILRYDLARKDPGESGFDTKYWSITHTPVFRGDGSLAFIVQQTEDVTEFVRMREQSPEGAKNTEKIRDRADYIEAEILRNAQDVKEANRQIKLAKEELERREQELARLNERLKELDQAKTIFFSNISHEFRTPLTLILGLIEDALQDVHTIPENQQRMEVAHRNALRLLKLVNTLLDFSRIEAGRIQASYRPTDLAKFTAELASNFHSATEKAGLLLIVDCPLLPEPVYVDVEMWEKIVLNLMSNAFKYTFEGTIEIRLCWQTDHAEFSVRDTGVGIPSQELPHLFERFHRIPGTRSRSQEGTGIGLALVKELVTLHGGSISVESQEGIGSTFTVSIPAGKAHLPADRIQAEPALASTGLGAEPFVEEVLHWLPQAEDNILPSVLEPKYVSSATLIQTGQKLKSTQQVLLVDDNADMRSYIYQLLAPFYDVKGVSDGEAALEAIAEKRPDLVLSDIMMPRLDGFGLLKAIRNDPKLKTLPVILLSARAGEEASVEGLSAGADDYLVKPFSANELLARVRTHLEMARIRRESEETLRQAQKMEVVGQLAGGAAHDFNSLLTVIMGRLQLLKRYIPNDEAAQRSLEAACHTTERASKLIRQLLAFARKQPLYVKAVSLNELITDMDNLLQNALRENIHLERNLAGDLWQALVDTTQIQLALLNLILNACDAMPEGGLILMTTRNMRIDEMLENIKPADLKAGEYVVLSVTDMGAGMSEEVLARAFEPFFTTKDIGAGSGLGLSQVYGTAKQLGGTVRLQSKLGQGTTVEIFLPGMADHPDESKMSPRRLDGVKSQTSPGAAL